MFTIDFSFEEQKWRVLKNGVHVESFGSYEAAEDWIRNKEIDMDLDEKLKELAR